MSTDWLLILIVIVCWIPVIVSQIYVHRLAKQAHRSALILRRLYEARSGRLESTYDTDPDQ